MFRLWLILYILNFMYVSLLFLIALDTIINASGGPRRLIKQRLMMHECLIINGLISRQNGHVLRVIIKVLPSIRIKPREIEIQGNV